MVCNISTGVCEPITKTTPIYQVQIGTEIKQVTGTSEGYLQLERDVKMALLRLSPISLDIGLKSLQSVLPKPKARVTESKEVNLSDLKKLIESRTIPHQTISEAVGEQAEKDLKAKIRSLINIKK